MSSNQGPSKALQTALSNSITAGNFIDTKFYVYSRRASGEYGRVDTPRVLYANSHVLKNSSSYFHSLFSDVFSDGFYTAVASDFPVDRNRHKDGYDYYSDSDLEEADETVLGVDFANEVPEVDPTENVIDGESSSEGNGDSVGVEMESHLRPSSLQQANVITVVSPPHNQTADPPSSSVTVPEYSRATRVLKTFIIGYTAFKTFHAVIWYTYTGEIAFSPLGSAETEANTAPESVPHPSAKSIYRFADEHKMVHLQELAYEFISTSLSELSPCELVEEAFTRFASWYPVIREAIIPVLCDALRTSYGSHTELFKDKIDLYAKGKLPYCAGSFVAISTHFVITPPHIPKSAIPAKPAVEGKSSWGAISPQNYPKQTPKKGSNSKNTASFADGMKVQENDGPHVQAQTVTSLASNSSGFWRTLKVAMKNSITRGIFDDVTYCIYKGPSEPRIALYCSRPVIQASSEQLFQAVTGSEIENGYDSDDDEDQRCVYTATLPETQLGEQSTVIRVNGSVTTWHSLLWYLYTGKISFAPLCSQGVETRKEKIDEWKFTFPDLPAPCSPKSIYVLAEKLSITDLKALAAQDIKSKFQGPNVIEELFPRVPTIKPILDIAVSTLDDSMDSLDILPAVNQKIDEISEGVLPHTAEALMLYFDLFLATKPTESKAKAPQVYPQYYKMWTSVL